MKRMLAMALLVGVFFSASLAQSPGYGLYSGWPTYLGVQFQSANLRLGLGLGGFGIAGDAALMLGKSALPAGQGIALDWYYGAGVGLGVWAFYAAGGFTVFPHGLLGVEYRFPGMPFSAYGELNVGVAFGVGNPLGFYPDFAGRAGVIFR